MENFVQALSALLLKRGLIAKGDVASLQKVFADSPKEYFDDFLLEEGLIQEPDLLKVLAELYNVPAFDVTGHFFHIHLLHMFPKDFLLRNAVIPLAVDGNIMVVVASVPEAPGLESSMREFVSYDITFQVGIRRPICDAVKEFYEKAPTEVQEDVDMREERRAEQEAEQIDENIEEFAEKEEE